jgi:hypothetical protein
MTGALLQLAGSAVERLPRRAMTSGNVRDSRAIHGEPLQTPVGYQFPGPRTMSSAPFEINRCDAEAALARGLTGPSNARVGRAPCCTYACTADQR